MCSPKKTESKPVQSTKAAVTSNSTNVQSTEAISNNARPQKDGFNVATNKTVVIGSYQIQVPEYFKKGSYSNGKKHMMLKLKAENKASYYL